MRLRITLLAATLPFTAQAATPEQFDINCSHTGSVSKVRGEISTKPANPNLGRHYSVDLTKRIFCVRRADQTCANIAPLAFNDKAIDFGNGVVVNRQTGIMETYTKTPDEKVSVLVTHRCVPATFSPIADRIF